MRPGGQACTTCAGAAPLAGGLDGVAGAPPVRFCHGAGEAVGAGSFASTCGVVSPLRTASAAVVVVAACWSRMMRLAPTHLGCPGSLRQDGKLPAPNS